MYAICAIMCGLKCGWYAMLELKPTTAGIDGGDFVVSFVVVDVEVVVVDVDVVGIGGACDVFSVFPGSALAKEEGSREDIIWRDKVSRSFNGELAALGSDITPVMEGFAKRLLIATICEGVGAGGRCIGLWLGS